MPRRRPAMQHPATTRRRSDGQAAALDGLTAAELAFLWRLALRLQACDTAHEAEALAAEAVDRAASAALAGAIAETVGPALAGARERERLRGLVFRDPLTGLFNRRFLDDELARQVGRVAGLGLPLAVALVDLDGFRDYNERHGHPAGDLALQSVAVLLQGFRQDGDAACRYGGDEFVLMMPGVTAAGAAARLEPLRRRLGEIGIHLAGRPLEPVTASIGVAECPRDGTTALLRAADRAMYRAKHLGGDRICLAETP